MKNILVSACLLGVCCRYDGAAQANPEVVALLNRDDITLIPVCPEQLGGMKTPRPASERRNGKVINCLQEDVTGNYEKGAMETLKLAQLYHCSLAVLKERSPSCGNGKIYDGTFSRRLISGDGVTSELLKKNGITILGESEIKTCLFPHTLL